jgi:RNA-binding protein YlmH
MNEEREELFAHLSDLKEKSGRWHTHTSSHFMDEGELAEVKQKIHPSPLVRYDGGYPGARKQKIIFLYDEEDDFSDVICLHAHIDQRFRKISHRDILGAVMHLQVERRSFGDFWIDGDEIYFYTEEEMADFFIQNLIRINQLNVSFSRIDEHPVQHWKMKDITVVAASPRADALVAALAHISRAKAREMIRQGLVSVNHMPLAAGDEVCNNNITISIRGVGRFLYLGYEHKTKAGRIAAQFQQYI